jgi:hypothetical protein
MIFFILTLISFAPQRGFLDCFFLIKARHLAAEIWPLNCFLWRGEIALNKNQPKKEI